MSQNKVDEVLDLLYKNGDMCLSNIGVKEWILYAFRS